MNQLKVLIICEESQAICKEFRKLGHTAFSCDLKECSGGYPEWHIHGDGIKAAYSDKWDLIIAHPPCTHLSCSGARHFEKKRNDGRQLAAIKFFFQCLELTKICNHIAIENPVNIIGGNYIKEWFDIEPVPPTQYIQPFEFGDKARKKTALWLYGLPKLKPTNIVNPTLKTYVCADGKIKTFSADYCKATGDRGTIRSKTYPGIARAIAEQWTEYLIKEC